MDEIKTRILSTSTEQLFSISTQSSGERFSRKTLSQVILISKKLENILKPQKFLFFQAMTKSHHTLKRLDNRMVVVKSGLKMCEKVLNKILFLRFYSWKEYQPYAYEIIDYDALNREILLYKFQKIILKKILKGLLTSQKQVLKRFCLNKIAQNVRVMKMRAFSRFLYITQVICNTTTTVEIVKNITIVEKYVKICEKSGDEILMSQKTKVLVERENENGEILAPAEVQYEQIEDFVIEDPLNLKKSEDSSELALINTTDQFEHLITNEFTPEKNKALLKASIIQKRRSFYKQLLLKLPLGVALIVLLLFLYKKIKPLLISIN